MTPPKVENKYQIAYPTSQVVKTEAASTAIAPLLSFKDTQSNTGLQVEETTKSNEQYVQSYVTVKSKDGKTYNFNKVLESRINSVTTKLQNAEKGNGLIGKAWSGIKNTIGFGDSSDKVREIQAKERKLLAQFNSNEQNRSKIFLQLAGVEYTEENLEKFINGQIKLKSEIAIEKYKEGQEMAVDITSDIVSGIVAYGSATLCIASGIAAAPFTAGASLSAVVVGIGIAAGAGAATKVAIKGGEALVGGKEYSWEQAKKDAIIGSVSGALAPVTVGAGGAVANSVGKVAPKFIATTARLSVEGATFGAADGGTRSVLEGDTIGDVALNTLKGAGTGALAGNILGHGSNAVSKAYNTTFRKTTDNGYKYITILNTSRKFKVKLTPEKFKNIKISDNSTAGTNVKNPNPENLYDELTRCDYSAWEVYSLLKNSSLDRRVGSLPNSIGIYSSETTIEVDKILSQYAQQYHTSNVISEGFHKELESKLSEILGTKANVKFLGDGHVGKVYAIEINGNKLVYKIYHKKPFLAGINTNNGHGNYPELLTGIRANVEDKGHFAELYMGRFGENEDGYLLTQFINGMEPPVTKQQQKMFKDFLNSMTTADNHSDNVVNGIIRDFGACSKTAFGCLSEKGKALTQQVFEQLDNNSTQQLKSIVELNKNKDEFQEMINYIEYLKQNYFCKEPEMFAEKEELFKILGMSICGIARSTFYKYSESIKS